MKGQLAQNFASGSPDGSAWSTDSKGWQQPGVGPGLEVGTVRKHRARQFLAEGLDTGESDGLITRVLFTRHWEFNSPPFRQSKIVGAPAVVMVVKL